MSWLCFCRIYYIAINRHIMGIFDYASEAFSYFEKAAKQGQARAQVELGDIYMFQKQEIDNAIFWWVCAYLHGESAL